MQTACAQLVSISQISRISRLHGQSPLTLAFPQRPIRNQARLAKRSACMLMAASGPIGGDPAKTLPTCRA